MTIDKFTIKAQETVQQAVNIARQNGQQSIEPVHLLKALMDKAQDITTFIFQKLGVNVQQLDMLASQEMQHLARVQGGEPYLSNDSQKVLQKAEDLAHDTALGSVCHTLVQLHGGVTANVCLHGSHIGLDTLTAAVGIVLDLAAGEADLGILLHTA